jgi:hypothetical protein
MPKIYHILPQLGVDNRNAIRDGALAYKLQFFGSNTAETVSANNQYGKWNGDTALSVNESQPWFLQGGTTSGVTNSGFSEAGLFAFLDRPGGVSYAFGHRTILSGY